MNANFRPVPLLKYILPALKKRQIFIHLAVLLLYNFPFLSSGKARSKVSIVNHDIDGICRNFSEKEMETESS